MKTLPLSEAVEKNANEIPWYPDYMKNRLIDWTRAWIGIGLLAAKDYSLHQFQFGTAKAAAKSSLPKKTGCQLTPEWKNPESTSAPNAAEPNSAAKPTFWTLGWIPQSPAPFMRGGLTEPTGNTCSQQACTLQAPTSSEHGHTTSWYAT